MREGDVVPAIEQPRAAGGDGLCQARFLHRRLARIDLSDFLRVDVDADYVKPALSERRRDARAELAQPAN